MVFTFPNIFQGVCFFLATIYLLHRWESLGSLGHYNVGFHASVSKIIKVRFTKNQIRSNHTHNRHSKRHESGRETSWGEEGVSGDGRETRGGGEG